MKRRSSTGSKPVKARRRKTVPLKRRNAAKDVFARKRTQLESRTTEQRWRSFLENPIFGITFVDEHQRFITTNQTFQTMVGYSNDELRQLTPLDISVPEEREINDAFLREIQQGKRHHFEMTKQLRRKDGKLIWINLYVFAITDRKSGAELSFGMAFDISEKKASSGRAERNACGACAGCAHEPVGRHDRIDCPRNQSAPFRHCGECQCGFALAKTSNSRD
jgi:PAS domain S-box-containing protein